MGIWKIIGGLVHNVRVDPVNADKVLFAPIVPICTKSSRLHQKFSPTQMSRISCTESFSERSKSSHLLQKLPFAQPFLFRYFLLIIVFFSKLPVIIFLLLNMLTNKKFTNYRNGFTNFSLKKNYVP